MHAGSESRDRSERRHSRRRGKVVAAKLSEMQTRSQTGEQEETMEQFRSEESCVVFGMPKAAIDRGYAIRVVALDALANTLMAQCTQDRKAATDPNDGIAAGAGR